MKTKNSDLEKSSRSNTAESSSSTTSSPSAHTPSKAQKNKDTLTAQIKSDAQLVTNVAMRLAELRYKKPYSELPMEEQEEVDGDATNKVKEDRLKAQRFVEGLVDLSGENAESIKVQLQKQKQLDQLTKILAPYNLMKQFILAASNNTAKKLETSGSLFGIRVPHPHSEESTLQITHCVICEQIDTQQMCSTSNYGSMQEFAVKEREGLLHLGWIHTHPTQDCFMSSVDIHTQFSIQCLMDESIAIVCALGKGYQRCRSYIINPEHTESLLQCGKKKKQTFHKHDEEIIRTWKMYGTEEQTSNFYIYAPHIEYTNTQIRMYDLRANMTRTPSMKVLSPLDVPDDFKLDNHIIHYENEIAFKDVKESIPPEVLAILPMEIILSTFAFSSTIEEMRIKLQDIYDNPPYEELVETRQELAEDKRRSSRSSKPSSSNDKSEESELADEFSQKLREEHAPEVIDTSRKVMIAGQEVQFNHNKKRLFCNLVIGEQLLEREIAVKNTLLDNLVKLYGLFVTKHPDETNIVDEVIQDVISSMPKFSLNESHALQVRIMNVKEVLKITMEDEPEGARNSQSKKISGGINSRLDTTDPQKEPEMGETQANRKESNQEPPNDAENTQEFPEETETSTSSTPSISDKETGGKTGSYHYSSSSPKTDPTSKRFSTEIELLLHTAYEELQQDQRIFRDTVLNDNQEMEGNVILRQGDTRVTLKSTEVIVSPIFPITQDTQLMDFNLTSFVDNLQEAGKRLHNDSIDQFHWNSYVIRVRRRNIETTNMLANLASIRMAIYLEKAVMLQVFIDYIERSAERDYKSNKMLVAFPVYDENARKNVVNRQVVWKVVEQGEAIRIAASYVGQSGDNNINALRNLYALVKEYYPRVLSGELPVIVIPIFRYDMSWHEWRTQLSSKYIRGIRDAYSRHATNLLEPSMRNLDWIFRDNFITIRQNKLIARRYIDYAQEFQLRRVFSISSIHDPAKNNHKYDEFDLRSNPGFPYRGYAMVDVSEHWCRWIKQAPPVKSNLSLSGENVMQKRSICAGEHLSINFGADYMIRRITGRPYTAFVPPKSNKEQTSVHRRRAAIIKAMVNNVEDYDPVFSAAEIIDANPTEEMLDSFLNAVHKYIKTVYNPPKLVDAIPETSNKRKNTDDINSGTSKKAKQ